MIVRVSPSLLQGAIKAPGSKSLMQRLVVGGLLGRGTSIISHPADNADSAAALECAQLLGADLAMDSTGRLHITGGKQRPPKALNVGESGLSMRLFTAIAAMSGFPVTIEGEGSLLSRPLDGFESVFPSLGAKIRSNKGYLPCTVEGPLLGGTAKLDGGVSSQFLSGLLMALPLAKVDSILEVHDLKSKPYVDMTLEVMDRFGVGVSHKDYSRFVIPGGQHYTPAEVEVDGDWSSAAALMVAGAVSSKNRPKKSAEVPVQISGLSGAFTQADSAIVGALLFAGARMANNGGSYDFIMPQIRGIELNLTDSPDLFPVLAALATAAKSPSSFTGVHRLRHKESDRGLVIQKTFAQAGVRVDINGDIMIVHPGEVKPCRIDSANDHRIAMAAAILGLRGGPIEISGAEAVAKSYPGFFDDLIALGAKIEYLKG